MILVCTKGMDGYGKSKKEGFAIIYKTGEKESVREMDAISNKSKRSSQ